MKARKSVMDLIEAAHYSGAVSSHSWSTFDVIPRIYKVGGVVTPMQDSAPEWIKTWRKTKAQRDKRFYFGFGYGADQNGLASQIPPREGVSYPFKSFDGKVTFDRERSGERLFDFSKDGVAHYGMFPDWWEDIRTTPGGPAVIHDMARGAEAYLQAWERVYGIRHGCKSRLKRITRRGVAHIRPRYSAAQVLRRSGQPTARGNYGWSWCVRGKKNRHRKLATSLTRGGKVAFVGTNAVNADAKRIRVGDRASRLRGHARALGGGLFVRGAGPAGPLRLRRARRQGPVRGPRDASRLEEPGGPAPLRQAREAALSRGALSGGARRRRAPSAPGSS